MKFLFNVFLIATLGCYVFAEEANKQAAAIKCYQCNELDNSGCKDPFKLDAAFLQPCVNGETFCRKTVQTINDASTVIRQCAKELYKPDYEGCYKTAGKASQNICTCKGNSETGCNNGLKLKSSIFGFVLSIIISVILLK